MISNDLQIILNNIKTNKDNSQIIARIIAEIST